MNAESPAGVPAKPLHHLRALEYLSQSDGIGNHLCIRVGSVFPELAALRVSDSDSRHHDQATIHLTERQAIELAAWLINFARLCQVPA